MKKSILIFMASLLFVLTTACGNSASQPMKQEDTLTPVKVSIMTDPETLHANQSVTIQAKVIQGDRNVDDANEVKFQVWEDEHQDQSEMIAGTHQGQGIYFFKKTFDHAGTYDVTAHVTARGMHTMPTKKLDVKK
jgi:maltose-binding protein MalE